MATATKKKNVKSSKNTKARVRKPRVVKPNLTDQEFAAWFSSLASVKACFEVHEAGTPIIIMRMKTEEQAILDYCAENLGGNVSAQPSSGFSQWRSASDDDALELLLETIDAVPMLTSKQQDYAIWKKYVQLRLNGKADKDKALDFRERLQKVRSERMYG